MSFFGLNSLNDSIGSASSLLNRKNDENDLRSEGDAGYSHLDPLSSKSSSWVGRYLELQSQITSVKSVPQLDNYGRLLPPKIPPRPATSMLDITSDKEREEAEFAPSQGFFGLGQKRRKRSEFFLSSSESRLPDHERPGIPFRHLTPPHRRMI